MISEILQTYEPACYKQLQYKPNQIKAYFKLFCAS